MANPEHVERLKQDVEAWNTWLKAESLRPDLSGADLSGADLSGATLSRANLSGADLTGAYLRGTDLTGAYLSGANFFLADLRETDLRNTDCSGTNLRDANFRRADFRGADLTGAYLGGANLSGANLSGVDLSRANLRGVNLGRANLRGTILSGTDLSDAYLYEANLIGANLHGANLSGANFTKANLSHASLTQATLVHTNLEYATLSGCSIYGISAWDVNLTETKQSDLIIRRRYKSAITVDNLEVAQFIYLMLNNTKIRQVIDTITSKAVLILGRFTDERKPILDALRDELRGRNYLPILFDFDKPNARDLEETISTLAHMARFVIADLTDAKSIAAELRAIVPNLPSVPIQPVIARADYEYALFEHIKRFPWMLETYQYDNLDQLLASLTEYVIEPAEAKVKELREKTGKPSI